MKSVIEFFGWYGASAIVTAYFLVSFSIIEPANLWYQILNLTGALGIVAVSLYKGAYQPALLNIVWTIVAFAAIVRLLL